MRRSETLKGLVDRLHPFSKGSQVGSGREIHLRLSREQALHIANLLERQKRIDAEEALLENIARPILRNPENYQIADLDQAEKAMFDERLMVTPSGVPTAFSIRWAWFRERFVRGEYHPAILPGE